MQKRQELQQIVDDLQKFIDENFPKEIVSETEAAEAKTGILGSLDAVFDKSVEELIEEPTKPEETEGKTMSI